MPGYPWPSLREPVSVEICDLRVDGVVVPVPDASHDERRLLLSALAGEDWGRLELDLRATLPPDAGDVLAVDPVHVRSMAVLAMPRSLCRIASELVADAADPLVRRGVLHLDRDEAAGRGELQVCLTAEVGGVDGRIVGSGTPWSVDIDVGEPPEVGGRSPFRIVWQRFEEERREHHPAPSHLDLSDPADPVLYLNASLDGLNQLLLGERWRGQDRDVRDLVGDAIAADALSAVVGQALEEVEDPDGEAPVPPGIPLFDRALEGLVREMAEVSDLSELLERWVEVRDAPVERRRFVAEVSTAIRRICHIGEVVERAAGRVVGGG